MSTNDPYAPRPLSYPQDAPVAPPYPAPAHIGASYVQPGDPDYDERLTRAKKRVAEVKGFYSHLASFAGVMTLLLAINLLTSPGYLWFVWPLLGWGIGLFFHAWGVFGARRLLGREWEERRIQEEMRRR